ncbi:MAG TPA: fused response regulator/phosphatase [Solirubrobacteraceae bacterium]|nr:fused response regulator/phosphatase [Solirubrobacteraceae bacterium]
MTPGASPAVAREEIGVLLVEDDEGDARLVEDELAERLPAARISRSRSLAEALRALDSRIDCVLLDLGLPDTLGMDAVARVRAARPGVPLIVLTGLNEAGAGLAAVEAGAQDYLVKGHVDGEQLARSIHYAIGRRRAEEAERELLLAEAQTREAERLEKGLVPSPLLDDPTLWVASCYRAGRSRALLGGDFFDLVQSDDGCVHVLVGDVCGQGPDEAAIGVSLRAAWRALALARTESQRMLLTMQRVLERERHVVGLFATLCTLEIEPSHRSARMIRAGHPQPVLIDGTSVRPLSQARPGGAAIGLEREQWRSERVELPAAWTILLYTDGIIEGRVGAGSERLGEAGLGELLAARIAQRPNWREQPQALLDELIEDAERLNGGALSDDVAMLLVGSGADAARA